MKITLWKSMAIASMGFLQLAMASPANAASNDCGQTAGGDQHWTESSPYYEQDAWYDVTEWFDGNDFHPTNESWSDTDDYANREVDDAYTSRGDNGYGYDNRYSEDNWFYDYYDGQFFTYDDLSNDRIYQSAAIYSDYDNDGYYDAVLTSYDWDGDGVYEGGELYTLNPAGEQDGRQTRQGQQAKDSRQQRLTGTVQKTKKASVSDAKHLVAMIKTDGGRQAVVDLGPAQHMQNADLTKGDKIACAGPACKVGEKRVVMADWVKLQSSDQKMKVNRDATSLNGKVADTKKANIRGEERMMVILKTDAGKKCLCDLGPADELDANFEQGDQLKVNGVPAKAGDRKVVLARSVTIHGDKTKIDRTSSQMTRNQRSGDQTQSGQASARVQGEVQSTRQIKVRGEQRRVAVVNDSQYGRVLIDLGAADRSRVNLQQGDRVTAHGITARSRDGGKVLLARKLQHNGQTTKIDDRQQRAKLTDASEVSGEVQKLQTVSINDSQRKLAHVKTDNGQTAVIDLGSPKQAAASIAKGDTITAEGVPVKVHDSTILVAFEVSPENGDSFKVDRGIGGQQASRR